MENSINHGFVGTAGQVSNLFIKDLLALQSLLWMIGEVSGRTGKYLPVVD